MNRNDPRSDVIRYLSVGVEFITIFVALLAGGIWLDGRVGPRPAWTIAGAVLGFAGGMYRLIRQAVELHNRRFDVRRRDEETL